MLFWTYLLLMCNPIKIIGFFIHIYISFFVELLAGTTPVLLDGLRILIYVAMFLTYYSLQLSL